MKNAIKEVMFDLLVNGSVSEMMKTMQLGMRHDDEDIRFVAQLCADEADTIEEEGAMVADYPSLVTKCDLYAEVVTLIVDSKL
jgi:hypothetical protein